jgi:ribonucleoside-diphosphate reductase alpha chain
VLLNNGQSLRVTPDHKIMTDIGWVKASDLIDHKVAIQKEASTKISALSYKEDLYEMLGWMVGDGWFTDSSFGLVFGKNDTEAQSKFVPLWNDFCGCDNKVSHSKNRNDVCQISCERLETRKKFEELGFNSSYAANKQIPSSIFIAPSNLQRAFIRGLFSADGGLMWNPKPGVRLASSSKELLQQVQLICIGLGIKSRIGWYDIKERGRSQGTLAITGKSYNNYKNNIGFILTEKTNNMRIGTHLKEDLLYIGVKSVKPVGCSTVYDIYEPITNSLIANGIVVHNCCLGSINLEQFVEDDKIIYSSLRKVVYHAVKFLDDVLDVSYYPLAKIKDTCLGNRKIGLGVMGFANMLVKMEIPYDSDKAIEVAEEVMDFINVEARKASAKLAEERGDFPNISKSKIQSPQRNATLTTIAPTGSISIIAETSSGIEPLFAVVYQRTNILEGNTFFEVNSVFDEIGKREGWYKPELINKIIKMGGKVSELSDVPEKWQRIFRTALEISPEWHVKMQAAFQRHTNNAISKTINMPFESTVEDVEKAIKLAYDMNLKGLTVFRNNSRSKQVLQCIECEEGTCPVDSNEKK